MATRQLRHGDKIIMSHNQDKQSKSLTDVNVSPHKVCVRSRDCLKILHREMKLSGMIGFILYGNYNGNVNRADKKGTHHYDFPI